MLHRHPFLALVTGGYLLFVAWLTLTPQPIGPAEIEVVERALAALQRRGYAESLTLGEVEFAANVALFVPVGVFALVLFGAGAWWAAVIACVALTVGIESAQLGIPGRVSDGRDLVANSLGGVAGVATALVLTIPATLRRRRVRHHRDAARAAEGRRRHGPGPRTRGR